MSTRKKFAGLGCGRMPLAVFLASIAAAAPASAALWDSQLWSLSGEADTVAGYDSNIFAVNSGPSDSFISFKPLLELSRKDSLLFFNADAWTNLTAYQRDTGSDSVDPGMRLTFAYPSNVSTPPTQQGEIHWIRTTDVNFDVGGLVSQDDALAKYEGDVFDAAKTSVAMRASLDRDQYLGAAYSTIDTGSVGATASYSPQELVRTGVGYDLTLGRSEANTSALGSVDQVEQAFTFQASGEFTPKLTGKFSAGAAFSDYTGSFYNRQWDAVAGADLTWKPVERLSFDLVAQRGPYFNANGDVDLATSCTLTARHDLPKGFSIWASGMAGNTDHDRVVTYRSDALEGAGAGLDYNLTGRLKASVGFNWTKQISDVDTFTFTRDVVTCQLTYRL